MSVRFTNAHIYVQFIDDTAGVTLAAVSTRSKATPDRDQLAANVARHDGRARQQCGRRGQGRQTGLWQAGHFGRGRARGGSEILTQKRRLILWLKKPRIQ